MTLSKDEADKIATELVALCVAQKESADRIKDLKAQLLEYTDVENINDTSWAADGGYVEVTTTTKYKLQDIPVDTKIDANVCAQDVAEKAFTSKVVLTKEGKQMLKEEYPSIMKLMMAEQKKTLKVIV